jgi:hypothetical protein
MRKETSQPKRPPVKATLHLLTTSPLQKSKLSPPKPNPRHNNPRHGNLLLTHVRPPRHGPRQKTRTDRPPHHHNLLFFRRLRPPRNPARTRRKHHPLRLCSMPQRPLRQLCKRHTTRKTQRHLRARKPVFEDPLRVSQNPGCCTNLRKHFCAESAVGCLSKGAEVCLFVLSG